MWVTITLIILGIWILKRYFVRFIIPRWVWPVIGFSLLFIVLLNGKEMLDIAVKEAKAWFPLVKTAFQNIMQGLRDLIQFVSHLGK